MYFFCGQKLYKENFEIKTLLLKVVVHSNVCVVGSLRCPIQAIKSEVQCFCNCTACRPNLPLFDHCQIFILCGLRFTFSASPHIEQLFPQETLFRPTEYASLALTTHPQATTPATISPTLSSTIDQPVPSGKPRRIVLIGLPIRSNGRTVDGRVKPPGYLIVILQTCCRLTIQEDFRQRKSLSVRCRHV